MLEAIRLSNHEYMLLHTGSNLHIHIIYSIPNVM